MLEDAVKSPVTLDEAAAAAWRVFCLSLSAEGGWRTAGGEHKTGPTKSEPVSGLRAAICMDEVVFAYASIQLCSQSLAMPKQRQACAWLRGPAQSLPDEIVVAAST